VRGRLFPTQIITNTSHTEVYLGERTTLPRLNSFVSPTLGPHRLRDLRDRDVERAMDEWRRCGQSRESIRGIQNALAAALEDAVRRELLAEVVGDPLEPLVLLIAYTGCRIGEALGACWADIDLDRRSWSLQRTLTRTSSGGVRLGDVPKAGEARVLPLSEEICAALRQQRRDVASLRLAAGALWQDMDLVFPSTIGTPIHPNNARTRFRPIAKRADFPASFHSLRHFMVSVAAASGESIVVVAKLIGHKRVSTTEDLYTHLFEGDALRVSSAVSSAVNGLKSKAIDEQKRRSEAR
jgi:integrase